MLWAGQMRLIFRACSGARSVVKFCFCTVRAFMSPCADVYFLRAPSPRAERSSVEIFGFFVISCIGTSLLAPPVLDCNVPLTRVVVPPASAPMRAGGGENGGGGGSALVSDPSSFFLGGENGGGGG